MHNLGGYEIIVALDNLIFLDFETTGLDRENDEIDKIGAIKLTTVGQSQQGTHLASYCK